MYLQVHLQDDKPINKILNSLSLALRIKIDEILQDKFTLAFKKNLLETFFLQDQWNISTENKTTTLNMHFDLIKIKYTGNITGFQWMIAYIDQYMHRFLNKVCINSTLILLYTSYIFLGVKLRPVHLYACSDSILKTSPNEYPKLSDGEAPVLEL